MAPLWCPWDPLLKNAVPILMRYLNVVHMDGCGVHADLLRKNLVTPLRDAVWMRPAGHYT